MKTLKKIGKWVTIGFGALLGSVFVGYLAGALAILLVSRFSSQLPTDALIRGNDLSDWRNLIAVGIGWVTILCFLLIRSLVSRPLGKLIEKSFTTWDAVAARRPGVAWMAQFILPKPSPEEIRAASVWKQRSDDFDKRIFTKEYLVSYESDEHEIIKHKKSLPSYPRLKRAGEIRAWFLGIPIVLLIAYFVLFVSSEHTDDTDDGPETDEPEEVAIQTASPRWSEVRQWSWNLTLISLVLGFPLWAVSELSQRRYFRILGAEVAPEERDDEIYVADPTSFESWRQAFIERHGHDMSADQEKKLRSKVAELIDVDDEVKIQEIIRGGPERIGATIDACCEDLNRRHFAQALLDAALEPYFLLQLAMFANKKVNPYVTIKKWNNAGLKLPAEGTPEFYPY